VRGLLAAWRADPEFVLNHPAYAGATILVASPVFGLRAPGEQVASALAGYGFRVVISAEFSDILYDAMINAGIVLAQVPAKVADELLFAVEENPQISIMIDLDRCEVSTRGGLCAGFEIEEGARRRLGSGRDALADLLLAAQRSLASRDLAVDVRIRLQRRLMAICDAMKAPGADSFRGRRRLERFLEELSRADAGGS
jgi:3-isopropylmalate/(R)-2-methylmalate dehydratase small subunit